MGTGCYIQYSNYLINLFLGVQSSGDKSLRFDFVGRQKVTD